MSHEIECFESFSCYSNDIDDIPTIHKWTKVHHHDKYTFIYRNEGGNENYGLKQKKGIMWVKKINHKI